jgi:hypothetical protein
VSSDTRKIAATMYFKEQHGCDTAVAGLAALAMMPLDDKMKPSRTFRKAARVRAKGFSKAVGKDATPDEIERLAAETLMELRAVAWLLANRGSASERYYTQRYNRALDSTPNGPRLQSEWRARTADLTGEEER